MLSQLSRTWYHLVKDNQEHFGHYPDGLNEIVDKHRAAGHPAARKAGVLDRDDRLGLRLVADELARRYPADRWTYVSLGNSPALFMECYAQVEPAAQVVLLPLSGVDGSELREPGAEPHRRLLDYADRLLPEQHHDRLVVVDMAEHGRGLAVTKQLLDAVLQRRGRAATTGLYALTPRKPAANGEDLSHLEPELSRLALLGDADTAPGHKRTVRKLRERLIGCYYKSDLLLNVFEKHNSMDVLAGARTGPTLDAGAYQRVQLVVRHARALLDAGPGQVG
ncbi:hypothetical protein KCV87_30555 [Actinosynnema pretiosum subsp. pretiosum]|uniref:Uncharacterized protein n=1 Tax=Actinosynnema pretiosum subsp. pretiosum TaxID=103721 RepID=A0AA45L5I1_9PSEU|nr:hypothetical protein APASM_5030 [Actinosynnema pretiosum subsp. pretiosum]QUF03672.1 hypothetical protein KCV87_30555 [Actinosynnema pretiosum subsp. pretiosum]